MRISETNGNRVNCARILRAVWLFAVVFLFLAPAGRCAAAPWWEQVQSWRNSSGAAPVEAAPKGKAGEAAGDLKGFTGYGNDAVPPTGGDYKLPSFWNVLASLMFVIGLILLVSYVLRRVWARGIRMDVRGQHVRVLDTLQLGFNRSIFLVQVGKRVVLLGAFEKGMQYLTEITDPSEVEAIVGEVETPPSPQDRSFASYLSRAFTASGKSGEASKPVSFADKLKERLSRLGPEDKKE